MKTVAFAVWHQWIVAAFGSGSPSEADWKAYLAFLREFASTRQRVLVLSHGSGLNTAQRRELDEIVGPNPGRDRRISVVTDSTFARGLVKALSFFDPAYRSFSTADLDAALDYLQVPQVSRTEMKHLATGLVAQVVGDRSR